MSSTSLVAPNIIPQAVLFSQPDSASSRKTRNVVCVGAHPDDPETGCGGTLAKLIAQGHRVTILYLTRGEAGIRGGEADKTAAIRASEATAACKLLRSNIVFADQTDGKTAAAPDDCQEFARRLLALKPDVVLTHWPIDTHHDHRTAAALVYQAWQAAGESFTLVYYEVMAGVQTHHFQPNYYVDISSFCDLKRSAIYAHRSQNPDRFYPYHVEMEKRRGSEANVPRAEAFFVLNQRPEPLIPFKL